MWIRKRLLEILEKTDTNLRIYLSILIISWVFIIIYLIKCENEKQNTQEFYFHKLEKSKIE